LLGYRRCRCGEQQDSAGKTVFDHDLLLLLAAVVVPSWVVVIVWEDDWSMALYYAGEAKGL
jgi:hypothetical protein